MTIPILLGFLVVTTSPDGEMSPDEFKREYTEAVAKMDARLQNVRIRLKRDFRWEKEPHEAELLRLGDKRASVVKLEQGQAAIRGGTFGRIRVVSPAEAFLLTRPTHDGKWLISERQLMPSGEAARNSARTTLDDFLFLPFAYAGMPLTELLFTSNTSLGSVKRIASEEGEVVEVAFELADPGSMNLKSGVFTFLRSHGWALLGFRDCQVVRAGEGVIMTNFGKLEYDAQKDYIYPEKTSLWIRYPNTGDKNNKHYNLELMSIVFGDVREEEFTLPYYGFPDFQDQKPNRRLSPYAWAAILALVGVVLLVLAGRARKRFS